MISCFEGNRKKRENPSSINKTKTTIVHFSILFPFNSNDEGKNYF